MIFNTKMLTLGSAFFCVVKSLFYDSYSLNEFR